MTNLVRQRVLLSGLLVIAMLFLAATEVFSQSRSDRRTIEEITENDRNLYAQANDRDADRARSLAIAALADVINDRYRAAGNALSTLSDITPFRGTQSVEGLREFSWRSGRDTYVLVYMDIADARENYVRERLHPIIRNRGVHWGLAYDESADAAANNARERMLTGIQVTIMSQQDLVQVDDGATVTTDFQNRVRAISNLTLRGLRTIQPFRMDDVFMSFVYLSEEGLERSMEATRNTVTSYVREGEVNERNGQFSRALQNYYKGYIYTSSYYGTMPGTIDGEEVLDMRIALRNKIRNIIHASTLRARPAYEASQGVMVSRFELIREGYRYTSLNYRFDFENTSISDALSFGEGQISFMNYTPRSVQEVFPISFFIGLGDDIYSDAYLATMEPVIRLITNLELPVNFRNVLRVDIEPEFIDNRVIFNLSSRNLMIRSVQWTFGDSQPRFGNRTEHVFQHNGIHPVRIQVNGDEELIFKRWVDIENQQLLLAPPEPAEPEILLADVTPEAAPEPAAPDFSLYDRILEEHGTLFSIRNWSRLLSTLQRMASSGDLIFGPADDFDDKNGLVAVIFDRNNVYDYFFFDSDTYKSFLSERRVSNPADHFDDGTERYIAWIKFEMNDD